MQLDGVGNPNQSTASRRLKRERKISNVTIGDGYNGRLAASPTMH